MSNKLQSVGRASRILLAFETEGQELAVGELAGLLQVHKSTASRLAATLSAHGLLERVPAGDAFRLGPELGRLGMLALGGRDLIEVARQPMVDVAARTGETATFTVRYGDEMATVAQVDGRYVVGVKNWVGRRTPLHCTSDGKVLLAFGDGDLPGDPLEAVTERTITDPAVLLGQLEQIRREGWGSAVGELEEGLNGVAAPVFDWAGRCRGALSLSGPTYRVSAKARPRLARECIEAAASIDAYLARGSNGD